jgi:ATP-binding cassette subfamily F protein 3
MISVRNLTLRRCVNVVLDRASVTFTPGEKIGLVGRNGAGKSSFFGPGNSGLAVKGLVMSATEGGSRGAGS